MNEYPVSDDATASPVRMKVVGVGGGGVNTVERLMSGGAISPETAGNAVFAAVNTDVQSLAASPVAERLVIGRALTRGLGAGGEVELGRRAAEADSDGIWKLVAGCDLVILIVALGGGTGSGAAPVIAKAAADAGAMVVAFVTLPFSWEGERRTKQARDALAALRAGCEAVIPLHNDMLLEGGGDDADVEDAFGRANNWVCAGLNAFGAMLFRRGLINIDFATLRSALPVRGGRTLFGVGIATGEQRHREVVEQLKRCPLLHTGDSVRTADTLVVHIVGGSGLSLARVNEILAAVKAEFGGRVTTVLGAVIDPALGDSLTVCVLGSSGIKEELRRTRATRPNAIRSVSQAEDPENFEGESDLIDSAAFVEPEPTGSEIASGKKGAPADIGRRPGGPSPEQTELSFDASGDFFADAHTVIDGQDIDMPTFQRRHIRIRL